MKNSKQYKLQNSKGQITFELIVILAVVSVIITAIFLSFSNQSQETFILTNTKAVVLNQIYKQNIQNNTNCYLKSMSFNSNQILLKIEGCTLSAQSIADEVEKNYCKIKPNGDDVINCQGNYEVKIL